MNRDFAWWIIFDFPFDKYNFTSTPIKSNQNRSDQILFSYNIFDS